MGMNLLVCVKRVPAAGDRITLTPDARDVDTRHLGYTVSPHEECAVEEAVRIAGRLGGTTAVLTLGPPTAADQLRDAMALGIERAILLETEPEAGEFDATSTAAAIAEAVRAQAAAGLAFDLLLFGNESADAAGYQVGIRVAYALGLPVVTGVKAIEVGDRAVTVGRDAAGGREVFDVPLPAVLAVKEGLNLPRYPSVKGRLAARKKEIETIRVQAHPSGLVKVRLRLPVERITNVEVLGHGPDAAPRVVDVLRSLELLPR
jgi:electron transfer flavoprotein beta subunit